MKYECDLCKETLEEKHMVTCHRTCIPKFGTYDPVFEYPVSKNLKLILCDNCAMKTKGKTVEI